MVGLPRSPAPDSGAWHLPASSPGPHPRSYSTSALHHHQAVLGLPVHSSLPTPSSSQEAVRWAGSFSSSVDKEFARGKAVGAARPGGEPWLRRRLEKADMGGVTWTSGRPAGPNSHPLTGCVLWARSWSGTPVPVLQSQSAEAGGAVMLSPQLGHRESYVLVLCRMPSFSLLRRLEPGHA